MSKKAEERLTKKNEKAARDKGCNARLAQSIKILDNPIRSQTRIDIENWPRTGVDKSEYKKYAFHWDLKHADISESWSWGEPRQWSDLEYSDIIELRLKGLENNSWQEVETQMYNGADHFRKLLNKYQRLSTLHIEAQQRWKDHEVMSQFERPFRLRVGTDRRIWGVRILHYFFLFWYERNHMICPVD